MISPENPDKPTSDHRKNPMRNLQSKMARDQRLPKVIDAYLKGVPVHQIAAEHGVTRHRVYDDLRHAREIWRKNNDIAIDLLVHQQLAKLDLVEQNAWEQFERSCKDAVEREQEKNAEGKVTKRRTKRSGQAGDPAYLAIVLKTVDQRCKLLKIGGYANESTMGVTAHLVEIVVENAEQVQSLMHYEQYEELLPKPADN